LATQVPWIDNRVLHTPIVSVEKRIQGMDSALSYMPLTLEISRKWIYAILGGFSSILPLGLSLTLILKPNSVGLFLPSWKEQFRFIHHASNGWADLNGKEYSLENSQWFLQARKED
jgi:hypothetical protein